MSKYAILIFALGVLLISPGFAQTPAPSAAPAIAGAWAGTWGIFNPAQGTTPPKDICKNLTAIVELKDGVYYASFEGDCGRPYKYQIKMEGRLIGKAVMFKGTTDLGPKDGGVFDWIGRANEKEFVGFFTSAGYTGTFHLTRPATPAPAPNAPGATKPNNDSIQENVFPHEETRRFHEERNF